MLRSRSIRWITAIFFFISSSNAEAQERQPFGFLPTQFEIGRRTYFDFGPPFSYYEILAVRLNADGTSIERTILTPASDKCSVPATIETKSVVTPESILSPLDAARLCRIADKEF